ncbi:MAG: aminopeptidase P family protein [Promethearchaeota archaeon]|nr:MAG: aminopeptidase P family protein [Candidatus Lokiarchaeota archaeon]
MDKPKAILTPPSKEEISNRWKKVRNMMQQQNLDYYISYDPVNIYYLTNFYGYIHERPFILVIPKKGIPQFIIPHMVEAHIWKRILYELEYTSYIEFPAPIGENWFDKLRKFISKDAKIGLESVMHLGIAEKIPGKKIITDIIDEVRIVKSDYEIGRITHACQVVNEGHKKLLEVCRPKVPLISIYRDVTSVMTSKILRDIPNANLLAVSTTGAVWPPSISHYNQFIPNIFYPMEKGGPHCSIVLAKVDGYGVEIERTFFLGDIPEKAKEPFKVMLEARALVYDLVKPGAIMSDIDKSVRTLLKNKGYGDCINHRTGHGFGITGHEAPYLAEGYDRKFEPNMVISIEPGIYIPELGGFRHSDTVLVTDDGNMKLTQAPEELDDVIISL